MRPRHARPGGVFVAWLLRERLVLCLFLAALAVRLHWNLVVHPLGDYVYSDMRGYWTRGAVVASDPWTPRPYQAFYPPGVHVFVGIVRALVGPSQAWVVLSVAYALLGAVVPPLVARIARQAGAAPWIAALAGAAAVPYYPLVALGGYLLSEPPFAAFLCWSTYEVLCLVRTGRRRHAVRAGLAAGLGAWVRPQILAAVPLWGLGLLLARWAPLRVRGIRAATVAVVAVVCLVPTALHLYHHTGRVGLVSENGSLNLVFGRCHATTVVANPAGPGQVRTSFSPPSLLQLARRGSGPRGGWRTLAPAGPRRVAYDGYIGDARIHRSIVRDCIEKTGWSRQLAYAAVHVWMLAYDNLMWPDSGRRGFRPPSRWWGRLVGRTLVPAAVAAMLLGLAGLWLVRLLPLYLLTAPLWSLAAVAAVFFGSIRLRVPYDGLLLASAAVLLTLAGHGARGVVRAVRARLRSPAPKPTAARVGRSEQETPMVDVRSMLRRTSLLAGAVAAGLPRAAVAGGWWQPGAHHPGVHDAPCAAGGWSALAFVGVFGFVIVAVSWMRLLSENRRLTVVQRLIEAGREVPPTLLTGTAIMDLRRGIVLVAAGVGLSLAGLLIHSRAWSIGVVPACIGIGYLVSYRLGLRRTLADPPGEGARVA